MELKEALAKRRTIRFFEQRSVPRESLEAMIDAARVTSCASNLQRLRYVVAMERSLVDSIFANTAWAGLLAGKRTPVSGKTAPAAFIAVLGPTAANEHLYADAGAAIQSMQLAAWGMGLGCCWIGSVNKKAVEPLLPIPEGMGLMYVVAVGYPAEQPCGEDVPSGAALAYYLDENGGLRVPKLERDAVAKFI